MTDVFELMDELKPCPFCGGKAVFDSYGWTTEHKVAKCSVCRAATDFCDDEGIVGYKVVLERWNRRAEEVQG